MAGTARGLGATGRDMGVLHEGPDPMQCGQLPARAYAASRLALATNLLYRLLVCSRAVGTPITGAL